jgi:hypothetical protein
MSLRVALVMGVAVLGLLLWGCGSGDAPPSSDSPAGASATAGKAPDAKGPVAGGPAAGPAPMSHPPGMGGAPPAKTTGG